MSATTLDEVLETVPGLHVSRNPVSYSLNQYSVRGIHTGTSPEVLLLINGVSTTNVYGGYRPQDFVLPVANISRIEVIRGPGSAVFGADAFAGTINVITKDSHELLGYTVGPAPDPSTHMRAGPNTVVNGSDGKWLLAWIISRQRETRIGLSNPTHSLYLTTSPLPRPKHLLRLA
ncbi:MAG: TonB-dependent receptor plug domain-containing protein [Planctomycetes bacterium]|nr:TonB-dependent receptor plug domain-containing protein [Planctomycetota bacterium]